MTKYLIRVFWHTDAIKLLKIMSGNKARISPVMSESILLETLETLGELPVLILSVGTNSASFIRKVKKIYSKGRSYI